MSKTSDILRELEDIGAVGGKIQEPIVRRPVPVAVFPAFAPEPLLAPNSNEVLLGFAEQLETLEGALRGMLEWCGAARESLLSRDAPEDLPEDSAIETSAIAPSTEAVAEVVTSPEVPEVVAKPKLSLAQIRQHFLDPDFQPEEPRANGTSHVAAVVVPTPEEKPNG